MRDYRVLTIPILLLFLVAMYWGYTIGEQTPIKVDKLPEHITRNVDVSDRSAGLVAHSVEEEPTLSEEDFTLICQVVSAESKGESQRGQMAVAETIKNRMNLWGKSAQEVCLAPYQYAKPDNDFSYDVYQSVHSVFRQNVAVFGNETTHFHRNDISPKWSYTKEYVGSVGVHKFYK